MEIVYVIASLHVALAGLVALAFSRAFSKSFLASFLTGLILTGFATAALLLIATKAKASISDQWKKPSYPQTIGLTSLPVFKKPASREAEVKGSLESKIAKQSRATSAHLEAFTSTREMRSLMNNDKPAYNRELFSEAERRVALLNSFISRDVTRHLESGILSETVERDDHVDLQALKIDVSAIVIESTDSQAHLKPKNLALRDEPTLVARRTSKSNVAFPGPLGKAIALELLSKDIQVWESEKQALESRQASVDADYEEAERLRLDRLASQKVKFDEALAEYEKSAKAHNSSIDMLMQGYAMGERTSVENYSLKVLNSSVYFDELAPRDFQAKFDETSQELSISVLLPEASCLQDLAIKCKVLKSRSAIEDVPVNKTEYKRLYSLVIMQLLIRAAHEISEADRQKIVKSISVVGTVPDKISSQEVPIAMLAGQAQDFASTELRGEVSGLFKALGGSISKDPVEGVAISLKGSIRGRD